MLLTKEFLTPNLFFLVLALVLPAILDDAYFELDFFEPAFFEELDLAALDFFDVALLKAAFSYQLLLMLILAAPFLLIAFAIVF